MAKDKRLLVDECMSVLRPPRCAQDMVRNKLYRLPKRRIIAITETFSKKGDSHEHDTTISSS